MNELLVILAEVYDFFGWAWWIEISTSSPRCTYFFGPFFSKGEAEDASAGYVQDLEAEKAQKIEIVLKQCRQPNRLTIF